MQSLQIILLWNSSAVNQVKSHTAHELGSEPNFPKIVILESHLREIINLNIRFVLEHWC